MRKFVMISPNFWVGQTGRELRRAGSTVQLAALYLLSNPLSNYTGLYRLPIIYIANDLGLTLDQVRVALAAIEQTDFARYDESSEYVWIVEGARHQLGEHLKASDHKVKFVNKEFAAISKSCPFIRDYFDKYVTSLHLKPRKDMPDAVAPLAAAEATAEQVRTPAPEPATVKALQPEARPAVAATPDAVTIEALPPADLADRLSGFLAEREERGATRAGSKAVAQFLLTVAENEGEYFAGQLLDLAVEAGDFDIIDYEMYREVVAARCDI